MPLKVFQNILLGISLAAPLGPATVTILRNGLRGGFPSAIKVALGVVAADLTYVFVAYFGLASFITIPWVKIAILTFGTLILLYLSFQTVREALVKETSPGEKFPEEVLARTRPVSKNLYFEGYAVNISNPLAVVWWLGVIGSVLAASGHPAGDYSALLYALTIVLGILIWHTGLSIFSHYSKKIFSNTVLRYISVTSGLVLFFFALRFGYNAILLIK